jgi:hypothetical protein
MFPVPAAPPDIPGHPDTPPPVAAHVPGRQFKASGSQVSRDPIRVPGLAGYISRQIPHPYPHFLPCEPVQRPQDKGERNIFMDTLIWEAIVMFGID